MIDSVDTRLITRYRYRYRADTGNNSHQCFVKKYEYRWRLYIFLKFLVSPSAGNTNEGESGTRATSLLSVKIQSGSVIGITNFFIVT